MQISKIFTNNMKILVDILDTVMYTCFIRFELQT